MAALPIDLYASYLTYKSDTNQVVSYLAEAAQECGFSLPNKPKGKSQSNIPSGKIVPISLFVPLAEKIIAGKQKATSPPRHVVLALDRAIATRKEHNLYHKLDEKENEAPRQSSVHHQDGLDTHLHFVKILEKVRTVLRPLYPAATQLSVAPVRRISPMQQALNRFRHLSVEQPTSSTIPELPTFVPSPVTETKYEAETIDDYEEAFLAACLLFDDFNEVRDVLRKSWKAYIWQNTDLASVSVVTDNAIAMVQQNLADFGLRFPKHADLVSMIDDVFTLHCKALDIDVTSSSPKPPFDRSAAVCADTSFLWIRTLWEGTRHSKSSTVPFKKAPSWDAQTAANAHTKYEEQKEFLTGFLSQYRQLAKARLLPTFRQVVPVVDCLTTILAAEGEAKYTSFLALFAMQMFLDIREELGSHCDRGFDDLVHCVTAIQEEAKEHQSLAEYYTMKMKRYWSVEYSLSFSLRIRKSSRLIQYDFFAAMVADDAINIDDLPFVDTSDMRHFSFLRHHPWLCGVLAFTAESDALNLGLELVNAHFLVVPAAHLYNTLRHQKCLLQGWPDIEHLIKQQDHLFFGGRPSNVRDCLKKFQLATGVSASAYARGSRGRDVSNSRNEKNRRKLHLNDLPVTQALIDEYQHREQPRMLLVNSAKVLKSLHSIGKSRGFDPSKTRISDWLKLLLHTFHYDSPRRQFNYLLMDRMCRQVLLVLPELLLEDTAIPKSDLEVRNLECPDMRDFEEEVAGLMSAMAGTVPSKTGIPSNGFTVVGTAIARELGADHDNIGITASAYATYNLADTIQHGGSPELRILFKTILLTHASTDESLEDIDNYFNNRGGDSMLKTLAPGEKLLGSVNKARAEDMAATAKHTRSILVSAENVGARTSPTKPGAKSQPDPQGAATKPSAPRTLAEFIKGLPVSDKSFPAVDVKAMCRELAEDGVLDALEQAMLMRTGR